MVLMQFGIFWTNGQICSATSRLLLQDTIADRFLERLKLRTEEIKVGNPLEQDTRLGPVVSHGQYQKVLGYIEVRAPMAILQLGFEGNLHCCGGPPPALLPHLTLQYSAVGGEEVCSRAKHNVCIGTCPAVSRLCAALVACFVDQR